MAMNQTGVSLGEVLELIGLALQKPERAEQLLRGAHDALGQLLGLDSPVLKVLAEGLPDASEDKRWFIRDRTGPESERDVLNLLEGISGRESEKLRGQILTVVYRHWRRTQRPMSKPDLRAQLNAKLADCQGFKVKVGKAAQWLRENLFIDYVDFEEAGKRFLVPTRKVFMMMGRMHFGEKFDSPD